MTCATQKWFGTGGGGEFYIFNEFRLRDDPIKLQADSTDVYEEFCVSNHTLHRRVQHCKSGKVNTEKDKENFLWVRKVTEEHLYQNYVQALTYPGVQGKESSMKCYTQDPRVIGHNVMD